MGWLLALFACSTPTPQVPAGDWANVAPAQVQEVLHGEGRAYLKISEAQYSFWASVPDGEFAEGDYVLLGKGPLRYGQRSAEASRLFDAITVIDTVAVVDEPTANAAIKLTPAEGGIDIATLYAQRTSLAGQTIKVRGRVIKAAKNIQGTNWYHISDGTQGQGEDERDLTLSSATDLSVGQVVVATGPLSVDRDLGFGYFYAALMEGARVDVEPQS